MTERNSRLQAGELLGQLATALETGSSGKPATVALTTLGSELGVAELVRGAELAQSENSGLQVVLIGPNQATPLQQLPCDCPAESQRLLAELLATGKADAAVTLHYSFPLGVASVGRVVTPSRGKPMLIASATGATASERVEAMVKNAIGGIAVAKSLGIARPTLGILNVEGARQAERLLRSLKEQGYSIEFADSVRADGGSVLRGNDLLTASADIVVTDTLTGNMLMKLFSAFTSGGTFETAGWGYGPGVGRNWRKIIGIISRASGAPVVANAIQYAAACSKGALPDLVEAEYAAACRAGLVELLAPKEQGPVVTVVQPAKKPVTAEITGVDILELQAATQFLWSEAIYAETGMGCAGPVIMVHAEDKGRARTLLAAKNYL